MAFSLTSEQLREFWAQGCLAVKNVFSSDEVLLAKRAIRKIWRNSASSELSGDQHGYRIDRLTERDPLFYLMMRDDRVAGFVADLIGPSVAFHHGKVHRASPSGGWHQDLCSYPHTNSSVIAYQLYLDPVDHEHGALKILPQSHKPDALQRYRKAMTIGESFNELAINDYQSALTFALAPGDVSVHHSLALHKPSACNPSKERDVVIFVFRATDALMLVSETTAGAHYGEVVRGSEPITFRVTTNDIVMSENCLGENHMPDPRLRVDGLRLRGHKCGMM